MKMKLWMLGGLVASWALVASGAVDFEVKVNALIPRLADTNVPARYQPQMELQRMAMDAAAPGHEAERVALAKVLAPKVVRKEVPQPARVWMVRQLQHIGRAEAVPALTQLLEDKDPELRECARRALEKNPAPEAIVSLRNALGKAMGDKDTDVRWKIGLIHSLGERGDGEAVALIARALRDAALRGEAARSLGRIASPDALAALWNAPGEQAVWEAMIEAANRRLAEGDSVSARTFYLKLYKPELPASVRAAALDGLIKTKPQEAMRWITEALSGPEPRLQQVAVTAVARLKPASWSQTLAGMLPTLSPVAKAQVLRVLDASAEPAVRSALNDPDATVRLAAIRALGRIGSAESVPALLDMILRASGNERDQARTALAVLNAPGVNEAVAKAAAQGPSDRRAVAIRALAERLQHQQVSELLRYAEADQGEVRAAAWEALGQLADDDAIEPMANLLLAQRSREARRALAAVVSRTTSRDVTVKRLLRVAAGDEHKLVELLEPLSTLGGPAALKAVAGLTRSQDANVRELAVRTLSQWNDFAAAEPLVELASQPDLPLNLHILALQGVVRLARESDAVPIKARVDVALAALKAARRPQEKKQVLSALGVLPHADSAAAIRGLLSDPELKDEAALAGVALAERLVRRDPATARALAQAVKDAGASGDIAKRANKLLKK